MQSMVKAWTRWIMLASLGFVFLWIASGCQRGLFPDGTPRSPYERYMTLHGEYRPLIEVDAYGIERPALRQRLRPLD